MGNNVHIEEYYGGFAIYVNGERFSFDQEDSVEGLVNVFQLLVGKDKVTYEEVC